MIYVASLLNIKMELINVCYYFLKKLKARYEYFGKFISYYSGLIENILTNRSTFIIDNDSSESEESEEEYVELEDISSSSTSDPRTSKYPLETMLKINHMLEEGNLIIK